MANFSAHQGIRLAGRGIKNYLVDLPLVVSFEVTLSCNCNCRHCDLGGPVRDERQLEPSDYDRLTRVFNPAVVQISGGEPLLRKDVGAIARAIKQANGLPYVILVTNGWLLNEEKYLELYEAGVNQFSVSLDFPDARHDEFRQRPGLYHRLDTTLPKLASFGHRDIILNSAITAANLRDLLGLLERAMEWGVSLSYSAYTPLRTGRQEYCVASDDDMEVLRGTVRHLIELRKHNDHIANTEGVLLSTLKFFEQGSMPNCKAGQRFMVVMPDGSLVPCSLHRQKYGSRREMIESFTRHNECSGCYVAIRSFSEPSLLSQMKGLPHFAKQLLVRNRAPARS